MAETLRRMPGLESTARAFFTGEARQTAHWQAGCDALDECGADMGRRDEMRAAAQAPFTALETFLMGTR